LEKLKRVLLAMPTAKSEARSTLVSTYYDTPTLALHRERLSLRVRKQGSEFVQTVKVEDPARLDTLERGEWDDHIQSKWPILDAPKTGRWLRDLVRDEELRPVFTTTVTRTTIEISRDPSARIEAAVDEGDIRTCSRGAAAPISEVELELKEGDPRLIFDVALQLLKTEPIRIEPCSKAERGYRLAGADRLMPQAVHVGPISPDPDMSVEAALQRIGRRCLTHVLSNQQAVLAGDPEGIHQMRVAVRRLRSALLALKRHLQDKHYHWASEELRWLARSLAPVRTLDSFASLVSAVTHALPACSDFEHLIDAMERQRDAALEHVKQAIVSERYSASMVRLLRWFAASGWRDQEISEHAVVLLAPIVDVAPDLIDRNLRKACKRSKNFEELTAAQRHRLRITLKRLHDVVEFLGSLFSKARIRTFVRRLKSLQDDLGYTNDVRVAYDLVDQIGDTTNQDVRAINRAGGIVLGWHERVLAERHPKIRKRIRRFRRLEPFW
jgi:inorganic triphosphatase YgiF